MGKRMRVNDLLLENGIPCDDVEDKDDFSVDSEPSIKTKVNLHQNLFKVNTFSEGGFVKGKGEVLNVYALNNCRPPNMNCRIESFGRICQKFDERRTRWVNEMGFGGLLNLAESMHLPRQLAYWLMTLIDPLNQLLICPDGSKFRMTKTHVRWILGIPSGTKPVPKDKMSVGDGWKKVENILQKYGKKSESRKSRKFRKEYTSFGITVTTSMMDRLEGYYEEEEEENFKSLFMIVALQMVLCPTQSPRLAQDLLPALSCVMDCEEYDWCDLVLSKLMESVTGFARRFYANGYAGGCGGCSIFVVIFYLDRLDINPKFWNSFPRISAWSMRDISISAKLDRLSSGDYGNLGMLDVAYGESHPRQPRDLEPPHDYPKYKDVSKSIILRERRRCVNVGQFRKGKKGNKETR